MMSRCMFAVRFAMLALLCLGATAVNAGGLLTVRSFQPFPEAMVSLEAGIKDHGYTVTRVQRVDVGLKKYGFKTDKYRIVFYGKRAQIQTLDSRYPMLVPYLPLNFTIFAEGDDTIITAVNPASLRAYYSDAELEPVFTQWERDIRSILSALRMQ